MELFLAQNHSAMTHLPTAAAVFCALAALAGLFVSRREIVWSWALLSFLAFATALPALATGVAAARGRFNGEGKPYIQSGVIVSDTPQNIRVRRHQMLGAAGTALAAVQCVVAFAILRGRNPSRYLVAALSVVVAVLWAVGGHLGGQELWGPATFPAFQYPAT